MARTIRTKVYKFNELSKEAKQNAVAQYLYNDGIDTDSVYDDAHKTVKAFHELFETKENTKSWLDFEIVSTYRHDDYLNLTGLRLRKYIINNFYGGLYKGKYFSLWSKKEKSYKHYKDGYPVLKNRHSRVLFDNACTLTGVCYDDSILQPVYDFLNNYKLKSDYYSYMNFETLVNDCFASLKSDIDSEIEAMSTFEYVSEMLISNEYEFLKDGTKY